MLKWCEFEDHKLFFCEHQNSRISAEKRMSEEITFFLLMRGFLFSHFLLNCCFSSYIQKKKNLTESIEWKKIKSNTFL